MGRPGRILLTGATGLLGRYLLRDLLLSDQSIAVLVRGARSANAQERVCELVEFWSDFLGTRLAQPLVIEGDLNEPGLGLLPADRTWLARSCRSVLHAAARVTFRSTADGEPWKTNVEGTQNLLQLCRELGMFDLHHVSTAFVCGERTGIIREDEIDQGQEFHNDYEKSKCHAERLVREEKGIHATVYRPSVIVGDSRTGYTSSYHNVYRFLELGNRLATPATRGRRSLPLRLPFTGNELRNLVPVDWVAQAIIRIVGQPRLHGRTYHLASTSPIPARLIKEVAEEVLAIDGVTWAGSDPIDPPTEIEELFLKQLDEYWPYGQGDPSFDCTHTRSAIPDLPAPVVDKAMLSRLIRFAVEDRWGRRRDRADRPVEVDCAWYIEQFFPGVLPLSSLAGVSIDVTIGLDVRGRSGGEWTCRLSAGGAVEVRRGLDDRAALIYRLGTPTFASIVAGKLDTQEAFFSRLIEIEGNIEKGLKLAVLLTHFIREYPFDLTRLEKADACTV
jgi:thioester reductase-like protein